MGALLIRTTGVEDFLQGGHACMKCLILGAPSAGKTRSASYWPKPIFADCEKGRMSLADRSMPFAEIKSTEDMDTLLRMLSMECKLPWDQRKYLTLVIDTVDAYQRLAMQERMDSEGKQSFSGWSDWGWLDTKMTSFVAKLQGLDMNIVANLPIKDSMLGEEDAKIAVTGPKLKGDFKDQIAAEFDLVGYMGTYWALDEATKERVLKRGVQWHSDPSKPMLKDRSGQLPKWTTVEFSDNDYSQLFGYVVGGAEGLKESQILQTLETDVVADGAPPMAPTAGGSVVGGGAMLPPASAKPPVKAAAPAAVKPPAQPAQITPPANGAEAQAVAARALSAQRAPATAETAPPAPPAATRANIPPAAVRPPAQPAASQPAAPAAPTTTPVVAETAGASSAPAEAPVTAAPPAAEVPAVTEEQAVANVQQALGGEVIPDPAPAEVPQTEVDGVAAPAAPAAPVAPESVAQQVDAIFCGTKWPENTGDGSIPGCGKQIITDRDGGPENSDVVEIAQLRTRTNLCTACFAAHRAASK